MQKFSLDICVLRQFRKLISVTANRNTELVWHQKIMKFIFLRKFEMQ